MPLGLFQLRGEPLQDIQKLMGCSKEAPFDSLFAYQKVAVSQSHEHPWKVINDQASTEYPMSIELEPVQEQLEYRLTYLPHVIPAQQARLILEQMDNILQQLVLPDSTHMSTALNHTA